ncbi:hypothetical protein DV515_00007459, partial [Chloebia gouldiae]
MAREADGHWNTLSEVAFTAVETLLSKASIIGTTCERGKGQFKELLRHQGQLRAEIKPLTSTSPLGRCSQHAQGQLCTNETQATRENFVRKLRAVGFEVSVAQVTAPAPAACRLLRERGLRPHLLLHDDLVPEFAEINKTNPNCVVLGDAAENFTYANLNEAFRLLIGMEKPVLISLGKGRYYKETDGLKLDVGAYMKALEYACDVQAEVVGKPAKSFFESALAELGVPPEQAIMIGDDIVNDVGGAQQCGMRALQVRTGKYRSVLTLHIPTEPRGQALSMPFPLPFPLLSTDAVLCDVPSGECDMLQDGEEALDTTYHIPFGPYSSVFTYSRGKTTEFSQLDEAVELENEKGSGSTKTEFNTLAQRSLLRPAGLEESQEEEEEPAAMPAACLQHCASKEPWDPWTERGSSSSFEQLPTFGSVHAIRGSRPSDENHPEVKPDAYVNNLAEAVDIILQE